MISVTTTKEIDLSVLDKALGAYGLTANHDEPLHTIIYPCEGSPVTQEELQNAIDAYQEKS